MKLIESGEGKIPLLSAIAILAISLTVNLPGLAISPVLGKLSHIMKTTPLQVQLLNVLPNLVTIPFILGSGKICTPKNQLTVLTVGLCVFLATGIGYFFANTMLVLIILSCLLGVGCGLLIPLAASLISQNFSGKPRGTVLGTKSGLSNFSVIVATLFVGWVAALNWHYAFIVYFIPVIPLCLVPFIRSKFINRYRKAPVLDPKHPEADTGFHFEGKKAISMMWGAIAIYFVATFATMTISYYLPFTMEHYNMNSGQIGVATAMYYLTATLAGFGLTRVIKLTGVWTMQMGIMLATAGLLAVGFLHSYAWYIIGILVMGFGYGLVQPILYDKTSYFAPSDAKSTQYFAYLLTFNYVGISSVPFIVEFFRSFIIDPDPASHNFSYIICGIILGIVGIVTIVMHKSFVVQAGVIPEGDGILKEPSSVIAPGDRLEETDTPLPDNQSDPIADTEAIVPLGDKSTDDSKTTDDVKPSTDNTTTQANMDNTTSSPAETTNGTTPEAGNKPATKPGVTMRAAQQSLEEAGEAVAGLRHEHAEMLRKESQLLKEKADELNKESQELIDEANELEDN